MPDVKYLKSKGVSAAEWKKYFTIDKAKRPKNLQRLYDLLADDARNGKTINLREWRAYHAVDLAYQVPFNQTTPTLLHDIMSRGLDQAQTLEALKNYGLSEEEMFLKIPGPDGKFSMQVNEPLFFQFLIPIVKAYVQIVLGQIFNERNTSPLLPYNPLKDTSRNRVLCEIWTDIVQTISTWYGYSEVLKQAIEQMLKYGIMLAFPMEEWHSEKQIEDDGNGPETITVREGIRYTHPHPTRMGYDLNYPLNTINTNTGCQMVMHWRITSYGEILDNPKYWNRKDIFCGRNWMNSPLAGNYFTEVYPCRFSFPINAGWGESMNTLREQDAAWYRGKNNRNAAVFLTEQFRRIVPFDYGLGDYKYPIWARFTLAGDDTIIWAAPSTYDSPAWFMGYDYDQNAARTPSLGLDLIPFQDHVGNILSQMILTAKSNLENTHFYDQNIISPTDITKMTNMGERRYRSTMYIPFDSMKTRIAQLSQKEAIFPVIRQQRSIGELQALIPMTLSILERVLQISAQESGAQASHQQSKAEVAITSGAGKNRRMLTASSVDSGIDAMKRQIHQGYSQYGDGGVTAQVSSDVENLDQILDSIGFKMVGTGEDKVLVRGHKKTLRLEGFAASNQGPEQPDEKEAAQAILQAIPTLVSQPDLYQKVGAKNILRIMEQAVIFLGGPKDFRLPMVTGNAGGQIDPAVQQALQQLSQTLMQTVEEKVAKPAAQQASKTEQEVQAIQQTVAQLQKIYDVAAESQKKDNIKDAEVKQKMEIKQAEAQADEQRKQQKHDLELQQMVESAHVEHTVKLESAKTDAQIERAKTAHKIAITPKPAEKSKA